VTIFQGLQLDMRHAAESEKYVEASQLKAKRDNARGIVMDSLHKAETDIEGLVAIYDESSYCQQRFSEINTESNKLEDLSLSTIHRVIEEDPSVAMTMTGRSFQINPDDRPIISKHDSSHQSIEDRFSDDYGDLDQKGSSHNDEFEEDGEHPLEGVPNHESLPHPEDIHQNDGILGISLTSSNSLTSTDSIGKIESILGRYRMRCFLSKNWSLREAALLKLSLILSSTIEAYKEESLTTGTGRDWWDSFSRSICIILERAIDDKIVQVFLTGLLLLDDCLDEIEKLQIS
jgi:hypothetical protein